MQWCKQDCDENAAIPGCLSKEARGREQFPAWSLLLQRTRYGRYIYTIGGSAEAARRAGINVNNIRTWAFVLCSFTAGIAGLLYASYLGGMSNNVNGGQLVLYAVAAAVIGGTSLMGGRGKAIHPLIGGLVLAVVANGLDLINITTAGQEMATALVLVIAVTIDSVVRGRGQHASKGSAIASVLKNLLQR